jgi:hypothetical protein
MGLWEGFRTGFAAGYRFNTRVGLKWSKLLLK